MNKFRFFMKGTACVISGDSPCKDVNANSQQCPCKLCLIKYELDINVSNFENLRISTPGIFFIRILEL